MSERLSIIIPIKLKSRIDILKKRMHLDQSSMIRSLLTVAVEEKEIEFAIQEFQKGRITLGEAVVLSNTDYWTLLDILHDRGIPANIDVEDQIKEIQQIKEKGYQRFLD
ncbi:MAG: UPF0175 family protein [Promethearchaeota archaeon]